MKLTFTVTARGEALNMTEAQDVIKVKELFGTNLAKYIDALQLQNSMEYVIDMDESSWRN